MRDFEHGSMFEPAELSGNLDLDRFEVYYQELFVEALDDGVITADERALLSKAAEKLGLDPRRLEQLEEALTVAYEAHHGVLVLEGDEHRVPPSRPSLEPLAPGTDDPRFAALQLRIEQLERRNAELEAQLEHARAQMAIEVDFSDLDAPGETLDDPVALHRRLKHEPRDVETLRALYRAHTGDLDRQLCVAHALVYLGEADDEQRALFRLHRTKELLRPLRAIDAAGWRRHLLHPDDEILTGEIFSVITSSVLLGHVGALRRAKQLHTPDPASRQDPETTTLAAARCFTWAAQLLGMAAPPLYVDASLRGTVRMVPGLPPCSQLGARALSGRKPPELAFLAGRHLAYYRQERFLRLLVPGIEDLEDLFLAALTIGNPGLPLHAGVKERVGPIAGAIEPLLEPTEIDRLRGAFLRFVENGGRTNLQRWAVAADRTAVRAGFALCDNLALCEHMLELDDVADVRGFMDDLLVFITDDRYAGLRHQIGIAIPAVAP